VEEGSVADIFDRPREAYTRQLLEAATTSDLLAQLGGVRAEPETAQSGA
jgi:peptide/nickel transport system ATP-binding protein